MKTSLCTIIFLNAIIATNTLKGQSRIECFVLSGGGNTYSSYNKNDKEVIQESNNILSAVKKIGDSSFVKPSKRIGAPKFFNNARHKIGFITGYGNQKALTVSYNYEILFFQFQYYYSLLKKKAWGIEILLQPQYNGTTYKNGSFGEAMLKGHELGLNMGILARKNIVKNLLSSYLLVSAGPHYVSGTPERQSDGFIFSDNFFTGISINVFKAVYFDIRAGFRHISNAGFKNPNKGINSLVINEGFFISL